MAEITNTESTPVNSRINGLDVHNMTRISIPQWTNINAYSFGVTCKKLILYNPVGYGDIRFWVGVSPSTNNYMNLKEGASIEIDCRVSTLYSCGIIGNAYIEVIVLK